MNLEKIETARPIKLVASVLNDLKPAPVGPRVSSSPAEGAPLKIGPTSQSAAPQQSARTPIPTAPPILSGRPATADAAPKAEATRSTKSAQRMATVGRSDSPQPAAPTPEHRTAEMTPRETTAAARAQPSPQLQPPSPQSASSNQPTQQAPIQQQQQLSRTALDSALPRKLPTLSERPYSLAATQNGTPESKADRVLQNPASNVVNSNRRTTIPQATASIANQQQSTRPVPPSQATPITTSPPLERPPLNRDMLNLENTLKPSRPNPRLQPSVDGKRIGSHTKAEPAQPPHARGPHTPQIRPEQHRRSPQGSTPVQSNSAQTKPMPQAQAAPILKPGPLNPPVSPQPGAARQPVIPPQSGPPQPLMPQPPPVPLLPAVTVAAAAPAVLQRLPDQANLAIPAESIARTTSLQPAPDMGMRASSFADRLVTAVPSQPPPTANPAAAPQAPIATASPEMQAMVQVLTRPPGPESAELLRPNQPAATDQATQDASSDDAADDPSADRPDLRLDLIAAPQDRNGGGFAASGPNDPEAAENDALIAEADLSVLGFFRLETRPAQHGLAVVIRHAEPLDPSGLEALGVAAEVEAQKYGVNARVKFRYEPDLEPA